MIHIFSYAVNSKNDHWTTYQILGCTSVDSSAAFSAACQIQLEENNKIMEADSIFEIEMCRNELTNTNLKHKLVVIDLTNFPFVSTCIHKEVPEPSTDKFYNNIYETYSTLKENECALVIVNTYLPHAGLKRIPFK